MAAKVKLESLTQAQLLNETLEAMESDLRIKDKKVARDFIESMVAVIEGAVAEGKKVMLFGVVNLTPGFVLPLPKRPGVDRQTGEETMLEPRLAKTRVRATVGKRVKDALPGPRTKEGKHLEAIAIQAKKAAEKRAREAAKAEADGGGKKKATPKKGAKKGGRK